MTGVRDGLRMPWDAIRPTTAIGAEMPLAPGATFGRSFPERPPHFTLKRGRTPREKRGCALGLWAPAVAAPDIIVQD